MAKFFPLVFSLALTGPLLVPLAGHAQQGATNAAPASDESNAASVIAINAMLRKCSDDLNAGRFDDALREVDAALQMDPHNALAYELRGSLYVQKKLWDRAEDDYTKALEITPDVVAYRYKLAEIKFAQKVYTAARARYVIIQKDPNLGALASYKILLCDLLMGNEVLATADLEQINRGDKTAAYYFGNAVWDIFHSKSGEANALFNQASTLFSPQVIDLYVASLNELRDLRAPVVSFTTRDGTAYNQAKVFVEETGVRVSTSKGWITVPIADLPEDLSAFPTALRAQITARREKDSDVATGVELLSFTTRNGVNYDRVKWSMSGSGLRILTSNGWKDVPMDQLPEDLSTFPEELRERLDAIKIDSSGLASETQRLTFVTKKGREFDQVKWTTDETGLRVLTSDGWTTIPYDQLPDDISRFPGELRKTITAQRQSNRDSAVQTQLLTFTTKKGEVYDRVRWSLDDGGLRVLTSDGWKIIPFDQLPDDSNSFSADLRRQISDRESALKMKAKAGPPPPVATGP